MTRRRILLVATLLGIASAPAAAQAPIASGKVVAGTLSFDGHATVGDFVGTTDSVSGELTGAPSLAQVKGWVEAPVTSLRTGKGKRDTDMNKSMESGQYPVIRYQLDSITPGAPAGDTVAVTLHGAFTIHGVTRPADLPGRVLVGREHSRVWAGTPLNLKDYQIGGLSKMLGVLKMHENIEVHVDVTFGHPATEPPR